MSVRRVSSPFSSSFTRGVVESAVVVASFLAIALILAAWEARGAMHQTQENRRWLIDGYNVLHTGVLHGKNRGDWWSAPARQKLLDVVRHFDATDAELWIVFDGKDEKDQGEGRTRTIFAESADAWLVAAVKAAAVPEEVTVVTADRKVADRARHRGARVVSPKEFLARCGPRLNQE